jgi:hypothetical protein
MVSPAIFPLPEVTRRIAMWSGPRNLSSAMMRSFGNRADCFVWDEPFYGAYLAMTGLDHPMRAEILAACDHDWRQVRTECLTRIRAGKSLFYQKHMTHHMLPPIDRSWLDQVTNCFLIRHPARVVASYVAKREEPEVAELGFAEQAVLYEQAARRGRPVVVDADDILADPGRMIPALCEALDLGFDPAMLSWPAGRHPDDGIWAAHWYGALERSRSFGPPPGPLPELGGRAAELAAACLDDYLRLRPLALKA